MRGLTRATGVTVIAHIYFFFFASQNLTGKKKTRNHRPLNMPSYNNFRKTSARVARRRV